jgi:hypothetical protein
LKSGQDLLQAQEALRDKVMASLTRINDAADANILTVEQIRAMKSMKGVEIRADIVYSVMRSRTFVLTQHMVAVSSSDSLTAAIVHDSYHADQQRRFAMDIGEKAERQASCFAVPILKKIGVDAASIATYEKDCIMGHDPVIQKKRP